MPTVVFIQGNAIPVKHTQRNPKKLECKKSRDENGNVQNWSSNWCRNCGGRKFWTWEKNVCSVTIPKQQKINISVSEKKEEKCSVRNKTCFETTLTQKVVCPQNGSHPWLINKLFQMAISPLVWPFLDRPIRSVLRFSVRRSREKQSPLEHVELRHHRHWHWNGNGIQSATCCEPSGQKTLLAF